MARRRRPREPDVPPELITFDGDEWSAADVDRYLAWCDARIAYVERVGVCWALCGPDAKYGDVVDVMNVHHAVRRPAPPRLGVVRGP